MKDSDRFRLLGTCKTPRVRIGSVLSRECRDCDVIVVVRLRRPHHLSTRPVPRLGVSYQTVSVWRKRWGWG